MRSLRPIIASLAVAAAAGVSLTPAMSASAADQAGAQQATQYQVTLNASAKEAVAKEDTVKLTGTVIPKPPEGSKVVVQVKYEGRQVDFRVSILPTIHGEKAVLRILDSSSHDVRGY